MSAYSARPPDCAPLLHGLAELQEVRSRVEALARADWALRASDELRSRPIRIVDAGEPVRAGVALIAPEPGQQVEIGTRSIPSGAWVCCDSAEMDQLREVEAQGQGVVIVAALTDTPARS